MTVPETIFWRGLRIRSVAPHNGEERRWETGRFGAGERCWVALNKHGQFTAAFTDGLVGISADYDSALSEACAKAYDFALYDASLLRRRLVSR